jgi:RecA/RadA recombinase
MTKKYEFSGVIKEMKDSLNTATKMREKLNARRHAEFAKSFSTQEELMQVKSWIPMKSYFKNATGGEGFPAGHITQIVGKPDSGKTTALMEGMVACQKAGGVVYLIDSEHKFSMDRLRLMGGIPEAVVVMQVESLEEAWEAIKLVSELCQEERDNGNEQPMLLAWDSLAASIPNKILNEKDAGDAHMAVEAKINNKNIRKLRQSIKASQLACVFINHYYMTVPKNPYEMPELVVKGGEELTFLSTLIIKTKSGAKLERDIKGKKQKLGRMTKFEAIKGHFSGKTMVQDVWIVDKGILESDEEYQAYRKGLREKSSKISAAGIEEVEGNDSEV